MSTELPIFAVMAEWQQRIGEVQGYRMVDTHPDVMTVATGQGEKYILKRIGGVDRLAHLESHSRVLHHLYAADVPVAVPILTDLEQLYVEYRGDLYTLSPLLRRDESMIPPSPQLYRNLGRAVNHLHNALASYPDEVLSWKMNFAGRALDEAVPVILANLDEEESTRFNELFSPIEQELRAAFTGLPMQIIHGDCHGGNILFWEGDVSGFIDMDLLPYAPRVYDVSYLFADRVKSHIGEPVLLALWLDCFAFFIEGYNQTQPLTAQEQRAIWLGMVAVQMIFVDWFFTHGDRDAAAKNLAVLYWIYQHRIAIESRISSILTSA